ncbi:formate dehydrogenase accessory protein FdhE [Selenomonas noxia]|uniref:formate dehydrogenase accessory protein FdhE n=1 Tax=Selenomonas noxia TaxID=135083 RepID=UPI00248AC39A|nr:formate dehydrogenase accessory protein FdhE [Selenomonas noxia]
MKAKKIDPMKSFLKKYPFLAEAERIYRLVDEAVGTPEPIQLPERAVTKTLTEKLPILQQETYKSRMVRAVSLMQEDVFTRIAEAEVPPLMQESAREYLAVLKKLRKAAKEEFITAALMQDKAALAALAEQHSLNEGFIRSTIWRMVAALVPAELKEPDGWNPDRDRPRFRENYCPVCGRRPVLAELRKYREGRTRDLICGGCGTRWLYARVGCVYCGNTNLEKMHTLEPTDSDLMRLDICDVCDSYIKTYRGPANGSDADAIYRQDWASVHLDLLAEEKGLHKKGNPILE